MRNVLLTLIFLTIAINFACLFSPTLSSNDAYSYAVITKNLLQNHTLTDLTFGGKDWLDKPHLPFWLTLIAFKAFGTTTFAYMLPGFIFHIIGAFFTYKLAKEFFEENTALLSALIYLTTLRLALSAIDIRAEAFLQAEIMAANFYFWKYYKTQGLVNIFKGGFWGGMALMTKGIFTLVPICSGLVCVWLYKKEFKNLIAPIWIFALTLCFVFALPEFVALYLQFDAQPQKVVFDIQNVSGIRWFFWDSQFGRFFNTGPIKNDSGNPLFFIHTFLWAFLPWTAAFFYALFKSYKEHINFEQSTKEKFIFLAASFIPTFILFSATKFQLDHYTNIIFPYAAIFCAYALTHFNLNAKYQIALALIITILIAAVDYLAGIGIYAFVAFLCLLLVFWHTLKNKSYFYISISVFALCFTLVSTTIINGALYTKYNAGYTINNFLQQKPKYPIYGYNTYSFALEFAYPNIHLQIHNMSELDNIQKPYYLLIDKNNINELKMPYKEIDNFMQIRQDRFIKYMTSKEAYNKNLENWTLVEITQ